MSGTQIDGAAERAAAYAGAKFRLGFVSGLTEIAVLSGLLTLGWSEALAGRLGGTPTIVVLWYTLGLMAVIRLVELPFSIWGRRIEISFEQNRQPVGGWLLDQIKGLALSMAFGVGAAEVVYWLLRRSPEHWWLWAWAAFAGFTAVITQLAPVVLMPIFFKFRLLSDNDPNEAAVVRRLEATFARLVEADPKLPRLHGIYEWKLGDRTAKANAALTGWGRTRRVIVSDTLLEAATPEEIEAVFVHELGHHVHGHIWREMGFLTALSFFGFWLARGVLAWVGPGLGLHGVADVAGMPLLLLTATLLSLALMPLSHAFTRAMERQADDYSFETLGTARPLMAGLERLARQNLAEVDPPRWKEVLLYSHPSIATRVRRGREWEAARGAMKA